MDFTGILREVGDGNRRDWIRKGGKEEGSMGQDDWSWRRVGVHVVT